MNILFLSIGRLNNINDNGIYTDLLRKFKENGHKIFAISPMEKKLNLPTKYTKENDVFFLTVRIGNITKTHIIEKGISTIRIEGLFLKAIKRHFSDDKFDLVLYSTPPVTFDKIVQFIKKRDNAKSYLLLKDIFPQNAVDLNMFSKTTLFYKYFRYKERNLYKSSDYIGCMSKANVKFLLDHNSGIPKDKVEICPNSIEPININISQQERISIRDQYGIPNEKTVFIYGGNLGKPQGIDFLIECIKVNEDNDKAYILIVGSGTEYSKLKSYFDTEKPGNAKLLSQLPKNDYETLANSCDVGLIFLDRRFTIPNFPSRLLSYMQASMPVLASTDVNTDVGEVIVNGKFGYWCESGDIEAFNQLVKQLCDHEITSELGTNARRYLEDHYTAKHSYDVIMNHFK